MSSLFPVCAIFGPVFLALGSLSANQDGGPYGLMTSVPGALMTMAALMMIFRELTSINKKLSGEAAITDSDESQTT